MRTYLFTAFLLMAIMGNAQDSIYHKLIEDAIRSRKKTDTVFYVDSSIVFWGDFSRFSEKGRVEGFIDKMETKTFMTFTRKELREVDRKMRESPSTYWPDGLFAISARVPFDSVSSMGNYMATPEFWKERKYRWYYHFSQPVFIRNNTVAIFRVSEMIEPSSGYDFFFVYVKENGNWMRRMAIHTGSY